MEFDDGDMHFHDAHHDAEGKEEDRSMAAVKLTVLVGIAAVAGIVIGRLSLLSKK